jgi:hypothetical protein
MLTLTGARSDVRCKQAWCVVRGGTRIRRIVRCLPVCAMPLMVRVVGSGDARGEGDLTRTETDGHAATLDHRKPNGTSARNRSAGNTSATSRSRRRLR